MSKVNNTCFASLISLIFCALSLLVTACAGTGDRAVWVSRDGKILKNGNAEYFIGTNLWYAGRLASDEAGRARLCRELDTLKSLGVTNLRVLAVEGEDPAGLEYALDRMEERGMCAVLFLNNAWEWSHGYADYLEAAGAGSQPRPSVEGYSAYMKARASANRLSSRNSVIPVTGSHLTVAVRLLPGTACTAWCSPVSWNHLQTGESLLDAISGVGEVSPNRPTRCGRKGTTCAAIRLRRLRGSTLSLLQTRQPYI